MPNKAKLVTRASSSSTVSADTIPKSASLTHAELDSNLINLRDATFGVASDDSTVIDIGQGNTLKVAGAGGVTTAVSGQTLTITGSTGNITIVGDDSTGTAVTIGETFKIAGAQNITTAVSGDTLTITGSKNIEVNEISSGDSSAIQINDNVNVSGTFNAKTIVTNDLISEDSAAINVVDGLNVAGVTTINNTLAVTSTSTFTGDATFIGSITGDTNGPVTIAPNGTGDVHLNADSLRIGDNNTDATIATRGTGDLIITTNEGSGTEGTIRLYDGANGNIIIAVNGTGKVIMGDDFTAANLDSYTNASNSFPGFSDIDTIKTNLMFTSNLAVPNMTTFAERHANNVLYSYGKADSSATTYNDVDFRWGNQAMGLFDMNGATANSTVTGSRAAAIRGLAVTSGFKNSGGGTKTTPNQAGLNAFCEIQEGHGGDLTVVQQVGVRSGNAVRANTGEFSRITNAYGYVSEAISTGGSGANGTNRFITNEYGFYDAPSTATSLITNHYGYYVHTGAAATNKYAFYSADDAYLSRLGTVEGFREKVSALTFTASIAVNTDLAPIFTVTLTGNTDFTLNNLSTGQTVTIIVTQDGTGGRTATFSTDTSTSVKFAAGSATLSTAGNAIDVVRIVNTGTNFIGILDKGFA